MTDERPKVLIFDDNMDWADQIAMSIRDRCDPNALTAVNRWDEAMASSRWDVIVVDEQIAGHPKTGTDYAEQAILKYGITSPVIVISGVWLLKDMESKHPGMFFGYVSKDHLRDKLPGMIDRACQMDARTDHVRQMTTAFAKKFGMLKKEFPLDLLRCTALKQLFESAGGKTVADLIGLIGEATVQHLDRIGKSILMAIDRVRT